MKIIEYFKKRRAIKAYVRVLPRLLKKRYGKHKKYTEGQVKKTVEVAGLDQQYVDYALAMYIGRREFEAMTKVRGLSWDYDEVRQEVADDHFNGDSGFTIHDAFDAAGTSDGFFGGGELGADGGDFDDGGSDVD